jgi:iron(III) transport system substrate-binding protein
MARKHNTQTNTGKAIWSVVLGFLLYLILGYSLTTESGIRKNALDAAEADVNKLQQLAQDEGEVVWYESSPESQFAVVAAAFHNRYPKVKLDQVRLRGGDTGTRIIAESQADAPTADVATTGLEILMAIDERGFLMKSNWKELGISPKLIATPYALISMASIYCLDYNTKLVSALDAPKNWEDLLQPKWKNKIGIWQKPSALALLTPAWGEAKVITFAQKLAEQNPVSFQSSFPLNDAVAAGEISVGVTIYHSAAAAVKKGAPLKLVFCDPTPYEPLCSAIPTKAKHPNAAKLFMSWLLSPEGAEAYERATDRGNPWIAGTEANKLLSGKNLSTFRPEQSEDFSSISKKLEKILLTR